MHRLMPSLTIALVALAVSAQPARGTVEGPGVVDQVHVEYVDTGSLLSFAVADASEAQIKVRINGRLVQVNPDGYVRDRYLFKLPYQRRCFAWQVRIAPSAGDERADLEPVRACV